MENDSLKDDFSLCLPKNLASVHHFKQSYCYEASLKELVYCKRIIFCVYDTWREMVF